MEKPMKKQKTKQTERGITLIALVVTIIVLLILAGVSIQMLTGQTGILRNAQQAREETVKGQIKEDVQRDIMEKMIVQQGDITADELYGILNNYFEDVPAPGEEADNPWNAEDFPESFPELKSKEGNYPFKLGDLYSGGLSGEETTPTTPPTPPTPPTTTGETVTGDNLSTYQGEYVNIGLDINGTNGTYDDWKLFYAENGRIFLIAADYVPVEKLESWNIIGDETTLAGLGAEESKGKRSLQKYSTYKYSVYWGASGSDEWDQTYWMGIPTIVNFMTLVKHTGYNLESYKANKNAMAVSQLLNTGVWEGIKTAAGKSAKIDFCIGGPTLEMWCAAWNAVVDESDGNGFKKIEAVATNSDTGYKVKSGETTNTYLYMNGTTSSLSNLDKLGEKYSTFFPHTDGYENCYGYWLASPSARNSDRLMAVDCDGSVGLSFYDDNYYGVRPVVCLTSGVQLQKNEEKSDGTKTIYDLV